MVPFFVYGKLQMNISVIIPAYNEAENIGKLVSYLQQHAPLAEIIVVDGGSTDDTLHTARNTGVSAVLSPQKGRAAQMNYGASISKGDVLYFIHADVFPPTSFVKDIELAIEDGYSFGRYIMRFNTKKWYLRINEWFTRFDWFVCYGGDQTLFVKRNLFESSGGFRSDMRIMEDFEFTKRLKATGAKYKIFKKGALISDRKYDNNSWWRVQQANYTIVKMYKQGASQDEMVNKYKEMLDYR
jgi:rSAM/selenodomain-associated transferase 2